jgi:rhodanese-related sulfurtransferase
MGVAFYSVTVACSLLVPAEPGASPPSAGPDAELESTDGVPANSSDRQSGVYCGVYCFYAALIAHGKTGHLSDLLDVRYISSSRGSTLRDLKRAADDFGMHTLAMQGMTAGMLRQSPHPVILHVRTARRGSPYQHWILYLGTEGGQARIIDPPGAMESASFVDILSRWDGVGMVISDQPVSALAPLSIGWLEQASCTLAGLLAAAVVVVTRLFSGMRGRTLATRTGVIAGTVQIAAIGATLSLGYHFLGTDGFFANPHAVANVVTAHHASDLPEISLADVEKALVDKSAVIIDARFTSAYSSDHIPGAISIPITATSLQRSRGIKPISQDARVIVYCQSAGCHWSDEIGSDLVFRGYKNVSVYRGGYKEWKSASR